MNLTQVQVALLVAFILYLGCGSGDFMVAPRYSEEKIAEHAELVAFFILKDHYEDFYSNEARDVDISNISHRFDENNDIHVTCSVFFTYDEFEWATYRYELKYILKFQISSNAQNADTIEDTIFYVGIHPKLYYGLSLQGARVIDRQPK